MKVDTEEKDPHETGPPVILSARGGETDREDNVNLLSARQAPGFRDARQLVTRLLAEAPRHLESMRQRLAGEGGLVGDEHPRGQRQRGCEAQHLLLATGEQPRELTPPFTEDREPGVGRVALRRGAEENLEVLLHRESREDPSCLGDEEDAGALAPVRRQARHVLTGHHHPPGSRRHQPGGDRAERRLARTVRAEQRDDLALGHRDVDAVEHLDLAVSGDDPLERQCSAGRDWRRHRRRRIRRLLVLRDLAAVQRRLGDLDVLATLTLEALLAPLRPDHRQDPVRALREVDRAEPEQDRCEVAGGREVGERTGKQIVADPREDLL